MRIAVIGAGTMGTGIAQVAALGGQEVILHDTDPLVLRRALAQISQRLERGVQLKKVDPGAARRARYAFTLIPTLDQCRYADVVIEAIYEDLTLKQTLFRALDELVRPDAILATTTNTLSVTALAAATHLPERVIGLHFCNPAHIMPLVEVVRAEQTSQDTVERALTLLRTIHKSPVLVQDQPGLIVNRVAQAYFGEALRLLDEGGLDAPLIDRLMEAADFPMGPFRLIDFLGVDTVFNSTLALFEATFHAAAYPPHPRLPRLIAAGRLGHKRGGGFYPA